MGGLVLMVLSAIAPADVPAQTISDEDAMRILRQLDEIEEQMKSGQRRSRGSALQRFREAAASPRAATEFYLECVRVLDFDSRNARASEFREWRDRNRNRLDSEAHALALQVQLQYLVLSIRAAEAEPEEKGAIVADLQQFVSNLATNHERIAPQAELLRRPVTSSVFARAYRLDHSLRNQTWEFAPLNYNGIFDSSILPYHRESNPDRLAQAWDLRIRIEQTVAGATMDAAAYERFSRERLPEIHWARATDLYAHGFRPQAIQDMLAIVRANTGHANAGAWIETLRASLVETFNTQPAGSPAESFSAEPRPAAPAGAGAGNDAPPGLPERGSSPGLFE